MAVLKHGLKFSRWRSKSFPWEFGWLCNYSYRLGGDLWVQVRRGCAASTWASWDSLGLSHSEPSLHAMRGSSHTENWLVGALCELVFKPSQLRHQKCEWRSHLRSGSSSPRCASFLPCKSFRLSPRHCGAEKTWPNCALSSILTYRICEHSKIVIVLLLN